MPSLHHDKVRWRGLVKDQSIQFYLGLFDSYDKAVEAEDRFKSTIPNHRRYRRKARR